MNLQELKDKISLITNETKPGANTAQRIGGTMEDIVSTIGKNTLKLDCSKLFMDMFSEISINNFLQEGYFKMLFNEQIIEYFGLPFDLNLYDDLLLSINIPEAFVSNKQMNLIKVPIDDSVFGILALDSFPELSVMLSQLYESNKLEELHLVFVQINDNADTVIVLGAIPSRLIVNSTIQNLDLNMSTEIFGNIFNDMDFNELFTTGERSIHFDASFILDTLFNISANELFSFLENKNFNYININVQNSDMFASAGKSSAICHTGAETVILFSIPLFNSVFQLYAVLSGYNIKDIPKIYDYMLLLDWDSPDELVDGQFIISCNNMLTDTANSYVLKEVLSSDTYGDIISRYEFDFGRIDATIYTIKNCTTDIYFDVKFNGDLYDPFIKKSIIVGNFNITDTYPSQKFYLTEYTEAGMGDESTKIAEITEPGTYQFRFELGKLTINKTYN